jgi:hypothetical protein
LDATNLLEAGVVVCLTRIAVPFAINSTGTIYQFAKGNYICTFDGKKCTWFYDDKEDKALV